MAQTTRDSEVDVGVSGRPVAGVVVVWSCETPRLLTLRVPPPGLVLGRESLAQTGDDRLSRQHARIRWNGTRFQVADLGSRNGTFVGGSLVADGEVTALPPVVVRTGRTISLLVPDIQPFEDAEVQTVDGAIVGPTLRQAWDAVERAARGGKTLLLTGESGAGKELAARAFHRASGATGELVAVNCAAIPAGVAERLLFGAKKGAYSGADKDADGYLVTADHGTLFLDEIAELDAQVQAKLLRVLETGEVMPLGAARPRPANTACPIGSSASACRLPIRNPCAANCTSMKPKNSANPAIGRSSPNPASAIRLASICTISEAPISRAMPSRSTSRALIRLDGADSRAASANHRGKLSARLKSRAKIGATELIHISMMVKLKVSAARYSRTRGWLSTMTSA